MGKRFQPYLYSLLFALLAVLGWYCGQSWQCISSTEAPNAHYSLHTFHLKGQNAPDTVTILDDNLGSDVYDVCQSPYLRIKASLFETDTEKEETVEASVSPDLFMFLKEKFGQFASDFVTIFHDRKIAVSLATSELLKLRSDDLYLQYRVIRL